MVSWSYDVRHIIDKSSARIHRVRRSVDRGPIRHGFKELTRLRRLQSGAQRRVAEAEAKTQASELRVANLESDLASLLTRLKQPSPDEVGSAFLKYEQTYHSSLFVIQLTACYLATCLKVYVPYSDILNSTLQGNFCGYYADFQT
ncbi:unnamed protein product [Protopolystoma xenopodis]|uniref:Uncharacterized protein n=1 Tax=Protopolystoma xenopodis TaxID=117903 RepID=A0A3S4ZWU9_9PLAT|nr:unnamed protein product [Protopolystoma xenopodis]